MPDRSRTSGTVALNGDTVNDTGSGSIIVENSTAVLDLEGATVSANTISNSGTINVTGTAEIENNLTIMGGALSIASGAKLEAEDTTDTLNDVSVTNLGTLQVDPVMGVGVNLILSGGTTVTGGTLTQGSTSGSIRNQDRRDARRRQRDQQYTADDRSLGDARGS